VAVRHSACASVVHGVNGRHHAASRHPRRGTLHADCLIAGAGQHAFV